MKKQNSGSPVSYTTIKSESDSSRGSSDIMYQANDQLETNGYWYLRSLTGDAHGPLTNSDSENYNMQAEAKFYWTDSTGATQLSSPLNKNFVLTVLPDCSSVTLTAPTLPEITQTFKEAAKLSTLLPATSADSKCPILYEL